MIIIPISKLKIENSLPTDHAVPGGCWDFRFAIFNSQFVSSPYVARSDGVSRAFLICPEPVRELTAGVGTRFVTLAQLLAREGHQVTVAVPNDPAEARVDVGVIDFVWADMARLGGQAEGHDWVLLHGHLGNHYLSQRDDQPVVVDLYDPFMIENLHYHRELGFEPYNTDLATWHLQMIRGDFFLCSSSEQRLYYLGWLTSLGRVNPLTVEGDPRLDRLIVELPFGTPEEDPPQRPVRGQVLEGVDEDAPVLYFGGIYDWYDPLVVLDALPGLLDLDPRTTVVFVEHPHPDLTPLSTASKARVEAERRGWIGTRVRFEPWRPYERRFELPQVCDLAVICHRPGLETDLSLRTRLVDLMWLGVPVVVTAGGTMARVVQETGAGVLVPPADPEALTSAVGAFLDDSERRIRAREAGRTWARSRGWNAVASPLLEFAEKPWRDPHRARFAGTKPVARRAREPLGQRLRRVAGRLLGST
jgi:glycosyltransferase involved in cell wall biosynthesis